MTDIDIEPFRRLSRPTIFGVTERRIEDHLASLRANQPSRETRPRNPYADWLTDLRQAVAALERATWMFESGNTLSNPRNECLGVASVALAWISALDDDDPTSEGVAP